MLTFERKAAAVAGAVLLWALGVAGCGEGPDGAQAIMETQSAVVDGTVTTARPEVGKYTWANHLYCSSTLIGQQEIMTAAHCISPDPSVTGFTVPGWELQDPNSVSFTVDTSTSCAAGCPSSPDCSIAAPVTECCDSAMGVCAGKFAVDRLFALGANSGANDIAVGHLTSPVFSASPASIATTEPINTNLTDVGYGCVSRTGNLGGFGVKRFLTYFYDGGDSQNYCAGDSGGPTFVGGLFDDGPIARTVSGYDYTGNDNGADTVLNSSAIISLVNVMNGAGVAYRPQVQSLGFRAPASANGGTIGSTSLGLRMEGIQIWSPEPGVIPAYRAYVQNTGWQGEVQDGVLAGTVGQSLRMEALQIRLAQRGTHAHVQYRVFSHGDAGFRAFVQDGQACTSNAQCPTNVCANNGQCAAGTNGQSKSIEAVQIQLL